MKELERVAKEIDEKYDCFTPEWKNSFRRLKKEYGKKKKITSSDTS